MFSWGSLLLSLTYGAFDGSDGGFRAMLAGGAAVEAKLLKMVNDRRMSRMRRFMTFE